ncbi:hypothetical protein [Stenoxybacter acetivorans]|uniref:hypothetical protein n=1 Tax=Stenoxybacter acetivorans TaxID=422441 RepID=UPI0005696161|nr:hypothetical protein [Stenoxybacter acetivorans]
MTPIALPPRYQRYAETLVLCDGIGVAAAMVDYLLQMRGIMEHDPAKYGHRCGWSWETARDLLEKLGFTRRAYEKARRILLDLGVIEYRRGGVHGKMHWRLNIARLEQLLFEKLGKPFSIYATFFKKDPNQLPEWLNADLWQEWLEVAETKRGKPFKQAGKNSHIRALTVLHNRGLDIDAILRQGSIEGWTYFKVDALTEQYSGERGRLLKSAQTQNIPKKPKHNQPPPEKTEKSEEIRKGVRIPSVVYSIYRKIL